jgi:hypothetical protein
MLAGASACSFTGAASTSPSQSGLQCGGVSAHLLEGWNGRVRAGNGGLFTLTLASFPLVNEADAVDEQSAKRMSREDVLVVLIGYGRKEGAAGFKRRMQLPLAVERMTVYHTFEHLPRGHRLARALFVASRVAYDAQVQFAQPLTSRLRAKADSALRLLRFGPSPHQPLTGHTRC